MNLIDESIEVLTDLIEINNDRVAGYVKAAEESKDLDTDLNAIFLNMANDSRKYAAELRDELNKLAGKHLTHTTKKGKIYQLWMDVNVTYSGYDRQSILESCELGEETVQKAYNAALASDAEIDSRTRMIIISQKAQLKTVHKLIKSYRDARWKLSA